MDSYNENQKKRKILLINPRFQITFMAYMLVMAALTIGVFFVANSYFFWHFKQIGKELSLPADHVFFQFLFEQEHTMNLVFLITSAVSSVFLILGGLVLSHRVAGPIYRITRHMKDYAEGKHPGPARFRDGDFFLELADAFNEHIETVKEREGHKIENKKRTKNEAA